MKYKSAMFVFYILSGLAAIAQAQQNWIIKDEVRGKSPATIELAFDLPAIPQGQQVRLGLDARVDWSGYDGSNPWMTVSVNGKQIMGPELINKPIDCVMRCGEDTTWVWAGSWRLCYAPDFSDNIRTLPIPYGWPDVDPYHFVWDITAYAKAGTNKLVIRHPQILASGTTIVLRNLFVEIGAPIKTSAAASLKSAPTGNLPTFMAENEPKVIPIKALLSARGVIRLNVAGKSFDFLSRTSDPNGKWVDTAAGPEVILKRGQTSQAKWSGTGYRVERRVLLQDDHIKITDTITNITDKLIGVIYENYFKLLPKPAEVLLCGLPRYADNQETAQPQHPSVIARWDDLTIGAVAENDLFRAQIKVFSRGSDIGLADPELAVLPGKPQTLEWSIYPVPNGTYWDFVNAVRRNWGCNITIPSLAFSQWTDGSKPADFYGQWVHKRALQTMNVGGQTSYLGDDLKLADGSSAIRLAEGTDIPHAKKWCREMQTLMSKLHAAAPDAKPLLYLHPGACTEANATTLYADSKHLGANGEHYTTPFSYPIYMYVPTLNDSYGKALMKTVEFIANDLKAGGIFMDEMEVGGTVQPYAYNIEWDKCTVIIDPVTHEIKGKRSNTALLTLPWKMAMIKYLRQHNMLIVGNTPAATQSMVDQKVLRFTELGSMSNLINTHLDIPWALGTYYPEHSDPYRAKMVHKALDKAGIVALYSWDDDPYKSHFMTHMAPITPVRLQEGMVLGKERIVTNRSGKYGWPDNSSADVYVYDTNGKMVLEPAVKEAQENGRTLTEVRMPSDNFAILVRKMAK